MSAFSALKKQKKSHIVAEAEKVVDQRLAENSIDDLQRISAIWSSMLDLPEPMLPSQAAAMLAVSELVRATTLLDSQPHWINAAAHAMLGAHSDEASLDERSGDDEPKRDAPEKTAVSVGFVASLDNHQ